MNLRSLCIATFACAVVFAVGAPAALAEDATVPDVVGLPLDQAQALLEQAGFAATVERVQGKTIGLVYSQDPGGFSTRAKGSTVRLVVGAGQGAARAPPAPAARPRAEGDPPAGA